MDFTPRPTMYRGVQMRSRLEAAWAEQFDAWGWRWEYEPQCFAGPEGQYLPDYRIAMSDDGGEVYVEIKPWIFNRMRSVVFPRLWQCTDEQRRAHITEWNAAVERTFAEVDSMSGRLAQGLGYNAAFVVLVGAGGGRGVEAFTTSALGTYAGIFRCGTCEQTWITTPSDAVCPTCMGWGTPARSFVPSLYADTQETSWPSATSPFGKLCWGER